MQKSMLSQDVPSKYAFIIALLLLAIFDWLFLSYSASLGVSAAIMTALIGMGCFSLNQDQSFKPVKFWGLLAYGIGALILAFEISTLSLWLAILLAIVGTVLMTGGFVDKLSTFLGYCASFSYLAPLLFPLEFSNWFKMQRQHHFKRLTQVSFVRWIMPIGIGLFFFSLFIYANPILEHWVEQFDISFIFDLIRLDKLFIWAIVITAIWAFLRLNPAVYHNNNKLLKQDKVVRETLKKPQEAEAGMPSETLKQEKLLDDSLDMFGVGAILRSLIVFNLLFAVQSILDGFYLWGGVALPEGMNYASYAHRGAYPLIVTALLAALFVLVALRPGSKGEANKTVRWLVYVWIGQNVLLVISSILRLDLYVSVYELTYLRIAAFIWMGLVALGLVLIIWRILRQKSGQWLIGANLATLGGVLIACCFFNFSSFIANYNVDKAIAQDKSVDLYYLSRLRPESVPAMLRYAKSDGSNEQEKFTIKKYISNALYEFVPCSQEWRSCTFATWRMEQELIEIFGKDYKHFDLSTLDRPSAEPSSK